MKTAANDARETGPFDELALALRNGNTIDEADILDAADPRGTGARSAPGRLGYIAKRMVDDSHLPSDLPGDARRLSDARHQERLAMAATNHSDLRLGAFEHFVSHKWMHSLKERYDHDATRAAYALVRAMRDLSELKASANSKRTRITSIEGRVKTEASFFRKLYKLALERGPAGGITQDVLAALYNDINDLCGIRFSCPYYDDVKPTIKNVIRPGLSELGYATELRTDSRFDDSDRLDTGDNVTGYRSYHFFIKIPAVIDIYGGSELCPCEVQARTELQHVWAVKSHDVLYKPELGWDFSDDHVSEDMKQISHHLRAVDQLLISVRDRALGRNIQ